MSPPTLRSGPLASLTLCLALALALSIFGCGSNAPEEAVDGDPADPTASASASDDAGGDTDRSDTAHPYGEEDSDGFAIDDREYTPDAFVIDPSRNADDSLREAREDRDDDPSRIAGPAPTGVLPPSPGGGPGGTASPTAGSAAGAGGNGTAGPGDNVLPESEDVSNLAPAPPSDELSAADLEDRRNDESDVNPD